MDAEFIHPPLILPFREREGAMAFCVGTSMADRQATNGFAFCPYPLGSLERWNWLAGYANAAFAVHDEWPALCEAEPVVGPSTKSETK